MNIQYFKNTYESFQDTSSDIPKINSNLLLWLDANDPNNDKNTPKENSELTNWIDKSSGKKNAVASSPGKIVKNDTNSNMILRLDKNLNYYIKYPSFPNTTYTIFTVQRSSGNADFSRLIHAPGASDTAIFIGSRNGNVSTFTGTDNWNDYEVNSPVLSNLNTWRLVTTVIDNKMLYPYVDGVPQENKFGITKPFDDLMIGYYDEQSWVGDVGDVLIFDKALNLADRISIETFLSKKWNIKLNIINEEPKRLSYNDLVQKYGGVIGEGVTSEGVTSQGVTGEEEIESEFPIRQRYVKKILRKKAIKLEAFKNELFSNILNGLFK
jgi:hypothetical protein